jgi:predicted dehydrogenase
MAEKRVALAGAGMVSRHHLLAWSRVPGARVVAVADPDGPRAEARAAEFGIAGVFTDADAMLRTVRPDALDIAAPVGVHAELCRLAAAHRVAILCQKPLCPTLRDAEALAAEIGAAVPFMVHENWRFRLPYRQARAWISQGAIGRIVSARLSFASSGLLGDRPALARQPFLAGLPRLIVFELLVHHLDVLRSLCGELTVRGAVLAQAAPAIAGEDTASVLLATMPGAPVVCTGTMAASDAPPIGQDGLEILGTKGGIRFDGSRLTLEGPRPEAHSWDPDEIYQSGYDACLAHFTAVLRGGGPFETGPEDNLRTLQLVEAAYSAAAAIPSMRA